MGCSDLTVDGCLLNAETAGLTDKADKSGLDNYIINSLSEPRRPAT